MGFDRLVQARFSLFYINVTTWFILRLRRNRFPFTS